MKKDKYDEFFRETELFIARKLKEVRDLTGISKEDLAKASGINERLIDEYESGVRPLFVSDVWEFAKVMNVPVDRFFPDNASGE